MKINKKEHLKHETEKNKPTRFKIAQKTQLVAYQIQRLNASSGQRLPPRPLSQSVRPIVIQYGHPVSTKKLKKSYAKTEEKKEVVQNADHLKSFNQRVVVVKGRLKKPITNITGRKFYPCLHSLIL